VKQPTEILDPPDLEALRERCLGLRKAGLTYAQIAAMTNQPDSEVRRHIATALRDLEDSELSRADAERRLMVEQLDDLIRVIRPQAVGLSLAGTPLPNGPVLQAVDRLSKLYAQKARLLGLDQAPSVDIMLRLQTLAASDGYDLDELEEIARDVLAKHKMQLPRTLGPYPVPETARQSGA